MAQDEREIAHLLEECRTVAENCLYTAQSHFEAVNPTRWRARLLLVIPAVVAAASGFLTAIGLPKWIGAFGAVAGLVVAVASILGVDREPAYHQQAGNLLTALRHEARALAETYWRELTRDQIFAEVRRINDRYNCLVQALECTDSKAFDRARKRIKAGRFEMDFHDSQGPPPKED